MKTFKLIDYFIQIMLIVAALIVVTISSMNGYGSWIDNEFFFIGYFVVGGWQLLSVIIHFFAPVKFRSRLRKVYLWLLLATLVIGLLLLTGGDSILFYLFGLLFWSPVLAILYLVTCIKETQRLSQEPA